MRNPPGPRPALERFEYLRAVAAGGSWNEQNWRFRDACPAARPGSSERLYRWARRHGLLAVAAWDATTLSAAGKRLLGSWRRRFEPR